MRKIGQVFKKEWIFKTRFYSPNKISPNKTKYLI